MSIDFGKCDNSSQFDWRMYESCEIDANSSSYLTHASKPTAKCRSNRKRVVSIVAALSNRLHFNKSKNKRTFEYVNDGDIHFACFPGLRGGTPKKLKDLNENLTPWQAGSWDKPRNGGIESYCSEKPSTVF